MSKTPKLRFPGFTDDWEQRTLGEVGEIVTGSTPPTHDLTNYSDEGSPWITPTDITSQTIFDSPRKISPKGESISRMVPAGTILVTSIASIGKNTMLTVRGSFNQQINAVIPNKKNDSYFLLTISELWSRKMKSFASSGTMQIVNKSEFSKLQLQYPILEEQQKIGTFFQQLDDLITLHQRKLSDVKKLKAGLLQKMFPKNGETVPEVRFPEFTNAWEQRKLGEVVGITMGQSPNSENYTDNPRDYILVQGNADMKEGHVVPRVWTTQVTKKAEKGDLILSVRAPVGDIGKTGYNVVLGRGVAAIKGNEFIFQQLGKMKLIGYWDKYSTGSTFESINSTDIKDAQINVSSEDEQQKIGTFFEQLDNLITLHQRKLEHLQQQKKALLQQMFI